MFWIVVVLLVLEVLMGVILLRIMKKGVFVVCRSLMVWRVVLRLKMLGR